MGAGSAVYRGVDGEALVVALPVEQVPRDSAERLGLLFDQHHPRLYRLARRLTGGADEARDLVQETFLRAVQAVSTIPSGASHEEAWLVRVLVNICRDGWRRSEVRKRLEPMRVVQSETKASNHEEQFVARTLVWQALEALPPRRRAALVLYELEGEPIPAIATLLGVSPVTIRWHLSRGRRDLARVLRQGGWGRQIGREGQEE
jgi:RNA polymerase sigma factor (sigma-70 family)